MLRWWKTPSWRRSLDEAAGREKQLERPAEEAAANTPTDSFNEVDFGSHFHEYLDPGYRSQPGYEESEKPSFEDFLSQPTTLGDYLAWQLGALTLEPALADAAEFVVGNVDEGRYLAASEEELAGVFGQIVHKRTRKEGSLSGALPENGAGAEYRQSFGTDPARHQPGAASRSGRRRRARPPRMPSHPDRGPAAEDCPDLLPPSQGGRRSAP